MPVRYRYTPYGEAHAESGPELLRARFDDAATKVEVGGSVIAQDVTDPAAAAGGALGLEWSVGLDTATLAAGLRVERLGASGWVQLGAAEVAVGVPPGEGGVSTNVGPPTRLVILAREGWLRGSSYRVALTPELRDTIGRSFGGSESLEWGVPEAGAGGGGDAAGVFFDKRFAARFESWEAVGDAVGGRFPGGVGVGFEGLWTDPVTGIAYARARWYDARNATWLSEDPAGAVDSPSLYAFVGQQPDMGTDPLGRSASANRKGDVLIGDVNATNRYLSVSHQNAEDNPVLLWLALRQMGGLSAEEAGQFFDQHGFALTREQQAGITINEARRLSEGELKGLGKIWAIGAAAAVTGGAAAGIGAPALLAGAAEGLAAQGTSDALEGHLSSLRQYVVSVGGGAVGARLGHALSSPDELVEFNLPPPASGADAPAIVVDRELGVIYLRRDLNRQKPYVGQACSDCRYTVRQTEHARANPDAEYEFEIIGRAEPGEALDRLEEDMIRLYGGPTTARNPQGALSNRRYQMNEKRYREAGGTVDRPRRPDGN